MKELSLDEIALLEEMKSNCLKKGQYIDDKAKDKFYMLCHLEEFGIAYYDLLDVIKEAREYIEQDIKTNYFKRYDDEVYNLCDELLEILDKEKE